MKTTKSHDEDASARSNRANATGDTAPASKISMRGGLQSSEEFVHIPIMLDEVLEGLDIKPDGIYVDGTLGGAGHSSEIARRLRGGRLIGIDRDAQAIAAATARLTPYKDRVTIVKDNYGNIPQILENLGIDKVDGILLDLGVSSHQLDDASRGFSYMADAPLDMRMDRDESRTAADIVNGYTESELYRIIRDYGEDNFAKNIAKHIVTARQSGPIETTGQLAQIISGAIPMKVQKTGGHPAKRTFQAIRIELNKELVTLEKTLQSLLNCLKPTGRCAIITFHSLEDRIVKSAYRKAENPCTCPPSFPVCVCGAVSLGKCIGKKPIVPSPEEQERNLRSRSAKLRVFEHI